MCVLQNLEFFVPEPELSFLKVCPSVVRLPPRQGARVEVSFCPTEALPEKGSLAGDELRDATDDGDEQEQDGDTQEAAAGGAVAPSGGVAGKDSSKNGTGKAKATAVASSLPASNGKNVGALTTSEAEAGQRAPDETEDTTEEAVAGGVPEQGRDETGLPLVPLYAGGLDEGGLMNCEEGDGGENEEGWAQEPWSRHGRWRVPCFLESAGAHSVDGAHVAGGEGKRGRDALLPPLALEVRV